MNASTRPGLLKAARSMWQNRSSLNKLLASGNYPLIRDFVPGHFYSPIPDIADLNRGLTTAEDNPEIAGVDLREESQLLLLRELAPLAMRADFPVKETAGRRYYLDNPFYSYGDGLVLAGMIQYFRPRRVVEIGSGFSSAAMLDTNERLMGGDVTFTFIEPYPDRLLARLTELDRQTTTILKRPVQNAPRTVFSELGEDDILFIDSSHVAKTGSDVCYLLFEVIPRLKRGVIVHFHDIVWPFEYPSEWLLGGRIWNEAYALRAFLQHNSAFEILFFNSYIAHQHEQAMRNACPLMLAAPSSPETMGNSSMWLRRI